MAPQATRFLAAAAVVAVLNLSNLGFAENFGTRRTTDSYGMTPTPAFNSPSAHEPVSMELWNDPAESSARVRGSYSDGSSCGTSACSDWCAPTWYGQLDMLIWWVKGNNVPALVTESPNGTLRENAGVLGEPTTEVVFGDTGIDDNYRLGFRLTAGYWLDDCQINGLEVTWFSLGDGPNSGNFYDAASGDATSVIVARPFYNAVLDQQDAQLVAFPEIIGGDVQSQTNSELHSLALLLRHNLDRDRARRLDLVGGYRYLRFRESLTIREHLVSLDAGGVVPVGTTFDLVDSFGAENDFHGGEIGLSSVWTRGSWDFDVLTKLALGNMHQKVAVGGRTVITVPTQEPLVGQGGLLALPTNMGTHSWNEFAMIPELNMNLRYRYSECLSLTMGYSLLWVTEVARTGDQIDVAVNTTQLPVNGGALVGPERPATIADSTDMWAQGLNLGVVWAY
ncbi:MAG: BBP7 family outer membrane beta-barrel protein [Pirellulaceae bacterium]